MMRASRLRRRFRPSAQPLAALGTVAGLLVFTAGPLLAEEAAGGGSPFFSINPGLIIWTWVIFLVLLFVLRKWAWGPILGALEAREKRIQQALEGAAREREEAGWLLEQQRQLLDQSREQAQHVLADSRKAAERLRWQLLEEARARKDEIVARAKDEIERERDQALEALRREAVDLSIAAAGRVLEKNLDAEDNRRLVEEYLERLAAESRRDETG